MTRNDYSEGGWRLGCYFAVEVVFVLGANLVLWLLIAPAYIRWAVQAP